MRIFSKKDVMRTFKNHKRILERYSDEGDQIWRNNIQKYSPENVYLIMILNQYK